MNINAIIRKRRRRRRIRIILAVLVGLWTYSALHLYQSRNTQPHGLPMYKDTYVASHIPSVAPHIREAQEVTAPVVGSSLLLRHDASTGLVTPQQPRSPRSVSPGSSAASGYRMHTTSSMGKQSGVPSYGQPTAGGEGNSSSYTMPAYGGPIAQNNAPVDMLAVISIPLAARSIEGGLTSDQTLRMLSPRRTIIHDGDGEDDYGDDDLRPDYDPDDPYFTPVGDTPWLFLLALALSWAIILKLRKRRSPINQHY